MNVDYQSHVRLVERKKMSFLVSNVTTNIALLDLLTQMKILWNSFTKNIDIFVKNNDIMIKKMVQNNDIMIQKRIQCSNKYSLLVLLLIFQTKSRTWNKEFVTYFYIRQASCRV